MSLFINYNLILFEVGLTVVILALIGIVIGQLTYKHGFRVLNTDELDRFKWWPRLRNVLSALSVFVIGMTVYGYTPESGGIEIILNAITAILTHIEGIIASVGLIVSTIASFKKPENG